MKKLIAILSLLIILGCGSDDDASSHENNNFVLIVTIDETTLDSATISWNTPTEGNYLYRVVLNNDILTDGLQTNTYTFTDLNENRGYNGTVFAVNQNGDETFGNYSFTTEPLRDYPGVLRLTTQLEVDNFQYTSVAGLELEGQDITNIDGLANLDFVKIRFNLINTKVSNLDVISNMTFVPDYRSSIEVSNNNQLVDINGLSLFFLAGYDIKIENNPLLTQIDDIQFHQEVRDVIISNCPIYSIPVMSTQESRYLYLENLPLTNLNAFSNLDTTGGLMLVEMPNLNNLSGLNELKKVWSFRIINNPVFESFEGAPLLFSAPHPNVYFTSHLNQNLTNYCGLTTWMNNTYIHIDYDYDGNILEHHYKVSNNAYNPIETQIESPTECSL
ncbi:fibronectin type III domain-containing protein [Ulvibacter antarcticus]|uniref:Fibronectin type-III domain-containing protein n=1 Tax=Ulvibacter antarcticus TaxID=442714 RepID=A0A3L9YIP4_9FLAO|nr:fibronectin type III domain-containing protein [Ulvibacter antarcticus]RMA57808.1 hypothetical protein BXY75_2614 [Ulvibacter antarcticus]